LFFLRRCQFELAKPVRIWPIGSAPPVADEAEPMVVQRSANEEGARADEGAGDRKPDSSIRCRRQPPYLIVIPSEWEFFFSLHKGPGMQLFPDLNY